jgi:hypothetical protein
MKAPSFRIYVDGDHQTHSTYTADDLLAMAMSDHGRLLVILAQLERDADDVARAQGPNETAYRLFDGTPVLISFIRRMLSMTPLESFRVRAGRECAARRHREHEAAREPLT